MTRSSKDNKSSKDNNNDVSSKDEPAVSDGSSVLPGTNGSNKPAAPDMLDLTDILATSGANDAEDISLPSTPFATSAASPMPEAAEISTAPKRDETWDLFEDTDEIEGHVDGGAIQATLSDDELDVISEAAVASREVDAEIVLDAQQVAKASRLLQVALLLVQNQPLAKATVARDIAREVPALTEEARIWIDETDYKGCEMQSIRIATKLDRLAASEDRPRLAVLATCVLMIGLSVRIIQYRIDTQTDGLKGTLVMTGSQSKEIQSAAVAADSSGMARRVVMALATGLQEAQSLDLPVSLFVRLERHVTGWALLLAGLRRNGRFYPNPLAFVAAEDLVREWTTHQRHLTSVERNDEITQMRKSWKDESGNAATGTSLTALKSQWANEDATELDTQIKEEEDPTTRVVCRLTKEQAKNSKLKEVIVGHDHLLAKPIAVVQVKDLANLRKNMIAEFPYAESVVDFVLGDLVGRREVFFRPVLLQGPPGGGKTRFANRLAYHLNLHVWTCDAAAAESSAFSGTEKRWNSAEPSHPFLAMSRGKMANPVIILDELEKAPTRNDYGRLWDCLLPFLEPSSAKTIQDKALQVEVDCSLVNYIATANSLKGITSPLLDRFRIITFPEPSAEHLPALIPPLIAEMAKRRGLDPRFFTSLSAEETTFLEKHWAGGSVRKLSRLLEAIINARERDLARH